MPEDTDIYGNPKIPDEQAFGEGDRIALDVAVGWYLKHHDYPAYILALGRAIEELEKLGVEVGE